MPLTCPVGKGKDDCDYNKLPEYKYKYPDSPSTDPPQSRHQTDTAPDLLCHFFSSATMAPSAIDPVLHRPDDMKLRHNPPNAPWVIQKFGGTSIGKFAENIAEKIVRWVFFVVFFFWMVVQGLTQSRPGTAKDRIAIVCSARSTGTKDEGTTSRYFLRDFLLLLLLHGLPN